MKINSDVEIHIKTQRQIQMKTPDEIHKKIGDLMYKIVIMDCDSEEREAIFKQIDALLWVIGEENGKPI